MGLAEWILSQGFEPHSISSNTTVLPRYHKALRDARRTFDLRTYLLGDQGYRLVKGIKDMRIQILAGCTQHRYLHWCMGPNAVMGKWAGHGH